MKLSVIILLCFALLKCGGDSKTPKGVKIIGKAPVVMRSAIDKGVTDALTRAKCLGYPVDTVKDKNITVEIVPSFIYKGQPHFRVKIPPCAPSQPCYKGTQFDHDGYLFVGGGEFRPDKGNYIRLPKANNFTWTATGMYNEMEHLILHRFDKALYNKTLVHVNSGHPILKTCN